MRRLVAVLILCLLLPLARAGESYSQPDARGDQQAWSLGLGTAPTCRDASLDVLDSGYDIGPEVTVLHIRFADLDARYDCGALTDITEREVLRTFHFYVDYSQYGGAYVLWALDEYYGEGRYVMIVVPGAGYGLLPVEEEILGNVLAVTIPTTGTVETDAGVVSYSLDGNAAYYGYAEATYSLAGRVAYTGLQDRFGATFNT